MTDNLRQPRLLADLPFDVLLKMFSECDVDDVLNLSAICKRLNQVSGEHKTWFDQATRLQIPIPTDTVPSTAELKNWVISWVRSDALWVKPRDGGAGNRSLSLHWFDMRQEDHELEESPVPFVVANLVPGGKFVVLLYIDGQIDLKEVKIRPEGEWSLQDVAQYKQDAPGGLLLQYWSQLLTETNLGHPLVAYVDDRLDNLLVFIINHVTGTIEQKQMVELNYPTLSIIHSIHAKGNTILCFLEHSCGWGITVSELGPNPASKSFALSTTKSSHYEEIRIFMVSENALVVCGVGGIHLYHIPELGSEPGSTVLQTLSPVWEWPEESKWFCGSVCMVSPQHPVLYLQGTSGTRAITFRMDACGRDPVVVKHDISGKLPAHLASLEDDNPLLVMKGRKGLYYALGEGPPWSEFATCLVGREELTGRLVVDIDLPREDMFDEHLVSLADFDEWTGRILIGTNRYGENVGGIRIYLADLPP